MAKIRVHEIAKELGIENKEVIDFLNKEGQEISSHMSALEDAQAEKVRSAFSGKGENADAPVKKKKRIIQVFHPQNARTREAKNFSKQRKPKQEARPAEKQEKQPQKRQEDTAPKKPLVRVPRAHPPASAYEPKVPFTIEVPDKPENETLPKTENGTGEQKDMQQNTGAAKPETAKESGKATSEQETRPEKAGQGNRNFRNEGKRFEGGRQERSARPEGGRNERTERGERGDFVRRDRRPDGRSQQGGFDRKNNKAGFDKGGEKRQDRGPRRGFDKGEGFRKDEMLDKGDSQNRQNRRPSGRPERKNADEKLDLGVQKTSRGGHKDKDKDKNKSMLKENKYTSDRNGKKGKPSDQHPLQKPKKKKEEKKIEKVTEIQIPEKLTIRELAEKMKIQPSVIVKKLFLEGKLVTVNQEVDFEEAEAIALDYDIIAEPEEKVDVLTEILKDDEDDADSLKMRPPVVCVMGHVDHGKTSLLDAIRDTHVTDREAGGITQSIGAYVVRINGQNITFLDTPGHEAFTAMRMRGANSTDIAVLVVAADDGVMPQTIEAINHAKAAGVEIIVAINKIDKPSANIERVKQELSEYELIPEDWGGSTIFVPVSAKSQEGIDNLLEMILLTAEVMELKANPNRRARALVLEAKLDKGKGSVANVLVQKGTLHVGDYIACGAASGRVRAMTDEHGRRVKSAGPSIPVEVQGLNDVPNAGEILIATETDKEAKNIAATFFVEGRNKLLEETRSRMSLDMLFDQIHDGDLKELNLIIKADVQGSVEAVKQSLLKLSNAEVAVKIVHGGVGSINESDVSLAAASNAIIIGFNVSPDPTAKAIAAQEKVDIRLYKVIYKAIEDVEAAMKGMLAPVYEEKVTGHAEIRQLFKASGIGTIAGSYVLDGTIERGCKVRITREGKQIFEGNLSSLKRFKDDVKQVKSGYECGLVFEDFNEVQELDVVEAYIMVEVPR